MKKEPNSERSTMGEERFQIRTMQTQRTEQRLFVATNILLLAAIGMCVLFAVLDAAGIHVPEIVFSFGSGLIVIGLILCVFVAWFVTYQFFMQRGNTPASGADYILLLVAASMPLFAIYVLRKIRRHQAEIERS